MRKLLLSIIIIQVFLSMLSLAESDYNTELLAQVFWDNLNYNGTTVDFSDVPPNYDESADPHSEDRPIFGYKGYWLEYWQDNNCLLDWMGISFYAGEEPPSFDMWTHWGSYYVEVWGDYFTELYYVGGGANPLSQNDFLDFWKDLTIDGLPVDPYRIPPNYDADIDVWRDQRGAIGYHWYWQFYLSMNNQSNDNRHEIKWKGVPFDPSDEPENYDEGRDFFYALRGTYGYLEYWAAHFLRKNTDTLLRWYK